jgi:hypothetical protein
MWRNTLSQFPTLFGRLVFLASLWDPRNDHYSHPALSSLAPDEADRALRNSHQQVFQEWISSGLAEQKSDLEEFLRELGRPRYALPYRELMPAGAHEVERQLYLADLETLLELLQLSSGPMVSAKEP